jgi:dihydrodipicolinate synthase/N-acetylneuraminate lyase
MTCKPDELRERIEGIVVGLPTLFGAEYSVDHQATRTHVEFLIEHGMTVLMISRGISELAYLTPDEIIALTKTVVSAADGRALVITSTYDWWTGQALEFAQAVQDMGADGCLLSLPSLFTAYDPALHDDAICAHFEAVARATDIGLLIHERPISGWSGSGAVFSLALLDRLADIDQVVGLKLEGGDRYYARQVVSRMGDRLSIIGDWGPEEFLFSHAYGVRANITGMGQFAPDIVARYWDAVRTGDLQEARSLVNRVITPWYAGMKAMDWVAAIKVSMELMGLPASPMRPPNAQPTPDHREMIRQILVETGLLS